MTKKLILLTTLLTTSFLFAQIINIPDYHFKNYLLENPLINTNGDNKITVAEAEAFTGMINLDLYGNNYTTFYSLEGIQYFKNITSLYCRDKSGLKSIDLSNNTALEEISITLLGNSDINAPIFALDFQNNTALTKLIIRHYGNSYQKISNIILNNCTALTHLELSGINYYFIAEGNYSYIDLLDLSNNVNLEYLNISSCSFENDLDLSQNVALKELIISGLYKKHANGSYYLIDSLDISNNVALEKLNCYSNQLTSLDVSNNVALKELNCYSNQLTSLDISNNVALEKLNCQENQLTSLDVSNCPNFITLVCSKNKLTTLNLKNGNNTNFVNCSFKYYTSYNLYDNPHLYCIQVDDVSYSYNNFKTGDSTYWIQTLSAQYKTNCNLDHDPIETTFCVGQTDNIPSLPITFNHNGYDTNYGGTWSPATIDTSTPGKYKYSYTYSSNYYLWNPYEIEIEITEKQTPEFNSDILQTSHCINSTPPSLPHTSSNGITGTWSPSTINTAIYGPQTYIFTPTDGICANPLSVEITIPQQQELVQGFSNIYLPTVYCINATPPSLPYNSINGITGTWSPSTINTTNQGSQIYTFTPNDTCIAPYQLEITVEQNNQVPPTGPPTQTFTQGQTLADLEVYYNNTNLLVWYGNSALTAWLEPTTPLVNYASYYAVSTNGFCKSDPLKITVTQVVSRLDFDLFGFSYYPNPVNDILTFNSNTPIDNIVISNMLGQEVNANLSSDKTSLDMSNLPQGNYFVKVTIEGVSKTVKVVKK